MIGNLKGEIKIMKLFDTHAHLDDEQFDTDREQLISAMRENGVNKIMEVGSDIKSSKKAINIAENHDFIYCSVGIHPEFAEAATDKDFETVRKLAQSGKKVKAIGEIGIDYHYDNCASREKQIACFANQIDIAKDLDLPIIVHDRDSKGDALKVLKDKQVTKGVIHCFSGSAETAKILVNMGLMISFTGVITFKNARKAIEALKVIPIDRLMIETDSPYMAPEPYRGRRNDSRYVKYIAQKMAEVKGMDFEELCNITYENGKKFFNID